MKRILSLLLTTLLLLSATLPALAEPAAAPTEEAIRAQASHVLTLLAEGDFEKAQALFGKEMAQALSAEQLKDIWLAQVVAVCGEYEGITQDAIAEQGGYYIYQALVNFSNWTAQVTIPMDASLALYGLQCAPVSLRETGDSTLPEGITEESVVVGEGGAHPLNGMLTLPAGAQEPLAAVVLVHGTGSLDMDETAYAYKPFRDIAWALAQRGYAVLRYDKRTLTYANELYVELEGKFTINEETLEDALAAQALLAKDSRIDATKIYVLGHSLGGMMAPRLIAESEGGFAGGILMAGTSRTLMDLIVDQLNYAIETGGYDATTIAQLQMTAQTVLAQQEALKDMDDEAARAIEISSFNGYFLKEMDAHPAADYITSLECPLFIIQGSKDMQVYADKDFVLYEALAEGRDNISLKLYDGLNHFMHPSTTDPASAAEYYVENDMDAQVLSDIADWLDAQAR